jgi:3-hydroxyacyl-CoA dehydrogenase
MAKQGLLRLFEHGDIGSQFVRDILLDTFVYAAKLIPSVSQDISAIDGAMKVGYNWKKGPFEMMDSLGISNLIDYLQQAGHQIPLLIEEANKAGGFYKVRNGEPSRITITGELALIERPPETLQVSDLKRRIQTPIKRNASASIWDAGDGVLLLEYHSKLNAMDPNSMKMILEVVDLAESSAKWKGILIANDSSNFCAGANLGLALFAANLGAWKELEGFISLGQEAYQALKYAEVPVVAAAAGMCIGGGCEILLHVDAVQAHSESYIGLVEVGVGIIPGWGGCKELLARIPLFGLAGGGPMASVVKAFETIGTAQVSKSAMQAKELGYLQPSDGITMNRDRLLADAKNKVLELVEEGYKPPQPHIYKLPGASGLLALEMALNDLAISGKATPHDVVVVKELAKVLSGGVDADHILEMTEEDILLLEREAIFRLARNEDTLARMEHMLAKGKPLRN